MKKCGIIYNTEKERAIQFYYSFLPVLAERNIQPVAEDSYAEADFFIVMGGDGTLLRASKSIYRYEKPVLAINMGSLGFLTDIREEEAIDILDSLLSGQFRCEGKSFLSVKINGSEYLALNDVVITRSSHLARMVRIKAGDGDCYINTYSADGVIISSPAGSTAYNLSAGGPILTPDLNAMVINPIAPHTLSARPIVVPGSRILYLESDPSSEVVQVMVDGQSSIPFTHNDRVEVTLSEKRILLIMHPNRNFYSVLREKLKWGDALF